MMGQGGWGVVDLRNSKEFKEGAINAPLHHYLFLKFPKFPNLTKFPITPSSPPSPPPKKKYCEPTRGSQYSK